MKPPTTVIDPNLVGSPNRSAQLERAYPNLPSETMDKGNTEKDPSGKDPHQAGAKLDHGKVCPSLIIEGMARAIWGVAEVATFGMMKYTRNGWVHVPDGQFRYANAGYRHVLKRAMGEAVDPDSELEHLKHEAWNAMAKLDLAMREKEEKESNVRTVLEHQALEAKYRASLTSPAPYHSD